MNVYTVNGVHDKEEWTGNYGPMVSYVLDLEDDSGFKSMDVKLNRKPESREPEVGERFVGSLESGEFGDKLKIDFEATKELNKTGYSGGSSETKTSNNSSGQRDDLGARIERQAILKVLSPRINVEGLNGVKQPTVMQEIFSIEAFIAEAGQSSSQGAAPAASSPQVSPPLGAAPDSSSVDLSGARTEEPTSLNFPKSELADDSHQWIESLLVVAGANHGARELALYAVNKLRPDQLKTLESELNDPEQDRKAHGLKRIEASYEKAEGHPLPVDNFDDLPFT